MKNALTIAGKELQSYFVSPIAYVVLTVFLLLGGWFFFALLRRFTEMVQFYSMMQQMALLKQINLNATVMEPLMNNLGIVLQVDSQVAEAVDTRATACALWQSGQTAA